MKYYFLNCLIAITIFVGFSVAQANGFGIKLDKPVGDYIINVDADAYSFISGEPVHFIFELWNKDRSERMDFDNVWVSLTRAQQQNYGFGNLFNALIGKPDFGGFRMTSILPEAGNYNLLVRYGKVVAKKSEIMPGEFFSETETIAEATFPITVEKGLGEMGKSNLRNSIISGILGLMIGTIFVFWFKRRQNSIK